MSFPWRIVTQVADRGETAAFSDYPFLTAEAAQCSPATLDCAKSAERTEKALLCVLCTVQSKTALGTVQSKTALGTVQSKTALGTVQSKTALGTVQSRTALGAWECCRTAQSSGVGLHWALVCSAVKENGAEKPEFLLVGNHQGWGVLIGPPVVASLLAWREQRRAWDLVGTITG
jgi:hypothetical protein